MERFLAEKQGLSARGIPYTRHIQRAIYLYFSLSGKTPFDYGVDGGATNLPKKNKKWPDGGVERVAKERDSRSRPGNKTIGQRARKLIVWGETVWL